MAGKISTLILTVDLQCYICTKKIKRTIFKLQAREQIQTVTYDEKNNTITISGLFDPQKLKKKLLCKACKEIKEIKIKEEEKPKPPAQKETKPPEPEKPKITQPDKPKEKPKEPEKPREPEKPKPPPVEQPKEKPKEKPKEAEKEKPKSEPVRESQPVWPVGPPLPSCCWRPCYEQYYGGCRCCSCGMFFGWTPPILPPGAGCMGGPSASTCQFISEEDPSCAIM